MAPDGSVIINQTFIREVMNGQNPVGHRIRCPRRQDADGERWYEVVGLVEDLGMDAFGPGAHSAIYHPLRAGRDPSMHMFVRVGRRAQTRAPWLRSIMISIDPACGSAKLALKSAG